jgi:hypothetical protein
MPARLIDPTEPIEITVLPLLIYGPPSSGKTTLAQTAEEPITLDLDQGVHGAANRKRAVRFDCWQDVIDAGASGMFRGYKTIVVDTGGRALDLMIPEVIAESSKNGFRGNLTPQGWGVVGGRFVSWMKTIRSWNQDLVILCHEVVKENAAGTPYSRPDLSGNMSWNELHKSIDQMGHIRYEGQRRFLDFTPSESQTAKDRGALGCLPLPDVHKDDQFLARVIAQCKERIGRASQQDAEALRAVEVWRKYLDAVPAIDTLNASLEEVEKDVQEPARRQVKKLVGDYAKSQGWAYDRAARRFVAKTQEVA